MSRSRRAVRPFTPSKEPAAALAARTVGRDDILDLLDRRLHAVASSGHRPHTLLVGPRGAGKTHLVEVALHNARRRAGFRDHVQVVRLDEDMFGMGRYRDVLWEILARLPNGDGVRESRSAEPEAAIARALGDRVLILVVENLDRLFHALGTAGQQDLRAWVETSRSVMLLATAPLLFSGIQDRNQPWYGNFGITHVEDLTVEDGAALLGHIGHENGDEDLVKFLRTDRGLARIQAINLLAGGSPRIWTILSDCISVESLDELTPVVEALLEGLVPYYQQLLWGLSANEQRLIRVLATGSVQAMTVTMLSHESDIDQRSAATSLGRLARSRWVLAEKLEGLDQRTTWYRLREPLLRHHLQYRSASDQPLPVIVDLLRAWFEPRERRAYLLGAEPGSSVEALMAGKLAYETGQAGEPTAARDQYTALLADQARVLGSDHPDTLTTRGHLAYWTGKAGEPTAARDQFAALLESRSRVWGAESTIAIRTQIEMLHWTFKAGFPGDAAQRLIALARTDRVLSEPSLRAAAEYNVGEAVLEVLRRASQGNVDPIDQHRPGGRLLADLRAAVTGEPEAIARIPSELRSIVVEVRMQQDLAISGETTTRGV